MLPRLVLLYRSRYKINNIIIVTGLCKVFAEPGYDYIFEINLEYSLHSLQEIPKQASYFSLYLKDI